MLENEYFDKTQFEKEEEELRKKTPYSLPLNPSDAGLPAIYIKSMEYMGYFLLHEWLEKLRKSVGDGDTELNEKIVELETTLKAYSDTNRESAIESSKTYADGIKQSLTTAIDNERDAREDANDSINESIGDILSQISGLLASLIDINTSLGGKLNTSGGTISNNLTILGNLTVKGESSEIKGTAIKINDALVVTNADGVKQSEGMIGFVTVINNNATENAYGIIYSNGNLELGLGTYANGSFTFKTGENFPLALRESSITNNSFLKWDSERKIFVDSGVDADFYETFYNTLSNLKNSLEQAEIGRVMAESTRQSNEEARETNFYQESNALNEMIMSANGKIQEMNGKINEYSSLVTTKSIEMPLSEFESITPDDDTYYFVYED